MIDFLNFFIFFKSRSYLFFKVFMVNDRGAGAICYRYITSSILSNKSLFSSILSIRRLLTIWLNPNSIAINYMWLGRFSTTMEKIFVGYSFPFLIKQHCVTFTSIYILLPFYNISLPLCKFYKDLHFTFISQHFTSIGWLLQGFTFYFHSTTFHFHSLTFTRIYILIPFHNISLPLCDFYKDLHLICISQHFTSIVWLLQRLIFFFPFHNISLPLWTFTRIYILLPFHSIPLPLCEFHKDIHFALISQHFTSIVWLLQGLTFYFHFLSFYFHFVIFTRIYILFPFHNISIPLCDFYKDLLFTSISQYC